MPPLKVAPCIDVEASNASVSLCMRAACVKWTETSSQADSGLRHFVIDGPGYELVDFCRP